ncbi:hypothetical protein AYX13_07023 [Cryptococcus neoformans]|nr:hypothetical protein AYX13_07023 [Cryptococcus neoformans var. grubii]
MSDSPDMPTSLVAYRTKLCPPLSTVMWHIAAYRKIEYASARTVSTNVYFESAHCYGDM